MNRIILSLLIICYGLNVTSNVFAGIKGRVIDRNGQPLADVSVKFILKGQSVTTKADGTFEWPPTSINPTFYLKNSTKTPTSDILFNIPNRDMVLISLFNAQGRFVKSLLSSVLDRGIYSMGIPASVLDKQPTGIYFAAIQCGKILAAKRILTLDQQNGAMQLSRLGDAHEEQTVVYASTESAVTDTIRASKSGYYPRHITINSYSDQNVGDLLLFNDVEAKVDSILKLMSMKDKVAQMTQVIIQTPDDELKSKGYGSLFNCGGSEPPGGNNKENWKKWIDDAQKKVLQSPLKIPMLYGIDAVHGNGKVCGSTIFPHNIGLGCTGDTTLIRRIGEITAKECAGVGVKWTFAPTCAVVRNEKWGRSYEGFGETGEINALMAAAMVRGMQGNLSDDSCIIAGIKHYAGEGGTKDGKNQGEATMSDEVLRKIHLPPYLAACKLGVGNVMSSYNAVNKEKCSGSDYLLNKILKGEMGFDGFIVSDWDAIAKIENPGNEYQESEIQKSVNSGMDMSMTTWDTKAKQQWVDRIESLASSQKIPTSRIDDAVRRILRIKFRLRLWDRPYASQSLFDQIGSKAHRDVARTAVRKSLVLLKNKNNALPLKKSQKVVVCGEWADQIAWACGGWTKIWQGNIESKNSDIGGTSLLKGMTNLGGANVVSRPDGSNIDSDAAAVVIFFGEIPYSEGSGDYGSAVSVKFNGKEGSYKMHIDLTQILAENDKVAGTKFSGLIDKIKSQKPSVPIICILISGRPVIINKQLDNCDAFVSAWLPGSEGQGVAEVLYGDYPFTGKLTHTWPKSFEQIPINTNPQPGEQAGSGGEPLFKYGFGLTY